MGTTFNADGYRQMTYAAWGVYILQSPSLRLVFFRENRLEPIQRQCTRDLLRLNNVSSFFLSSLMLY